MTIEDLRQYKDDELHRLGLRMRRVLSGRETTEDLAGDLARGDAAYRVLYDRYAVPLFYYIRDEVLFADEFHEFAEDAVQCVFAQIYLRVEETLPGIDLWGLLRCCAHDRARDLARSYAKLRSRRKKKGAGPTPVTTGEETADEHRRRQFNNVAPGQLESLKTREPSPDRALLDGEIEDRDLARVLNELSPDERRLVQDFYVREVSIEEL